MSALHSGLGFRLKNPLLGAAALVAFQRNEAGTLSRTVQTELLLNSITPFHCGAKGDWNGTTGTDDTAALNAWFAAIAGGKAGYLPPYRFRFTAALHGPLVDNVTIMGAGRSVSGLVYAGADTTIDLLTFGDGVTYRTGWTVSGFNVDSVTKMTAGIAVHFHKFNNGNELLDVDCSVMTAPQNLWNGVYLDWVNVFRYDGFRINVQNEGVMVSGNATDDSGSDVTLDHGTVTFAALGYHCGGGMGGMYFGDLLAFGNFTNFRVDNALKPWRNREIYWSELCISDGCRDYGIHINDTLTSNAPIALNACVGSAGLIGSGGPGHGIYIESWPNGRVTIGPGQLFNCTGSGLAVNDASCLISISKERHIFNNTGWGIYSNPVHNSIFFEGQAWNNGAGNFSPNANVGVWSQYTPVVAAGTGALGAYSAHGRYRVVAKTVEFQIDMEITANNTGGGNIAVNLPLSAKTYAWASGREIGVSGRMLGGIASGSAALVITDYANGYPGADGAVLVVAGTYEAV